MVAVGALATGIVFFDPEGFAENVLAEVAGITLGALVAIAVVDRLLTARRSREWARVRVAILRSLCQYLDELALDFYLVYPVPGSADATLLQDLALKSGKKAATAMETLADQTRARAQQPQVGRSSDSSSSRDLYTAASTPLRAIREVHTPRVIGVAEEPELVELLTTLEERDPKWAVALYNIEEWGAPDEIGWEAAQRMPVKTGLAQTPAFRRVLRGAIRVRVAPLCSDCKLSFSHRGELNQAGV